MIKKGFKVKDISTPEETIYMRGRQIENVERAKRSKNEEWMANKLINHGHCYIWTRQPIFGFRLFDFWNAEKGIVVEVDGPEHNKNWDELRDNYFFKSQGIVTLRVRNGNEKDSKKVLDLIESLPTWDERRRKMGLSVAPACRTQTARRQKLLCKLKSGVQIKPSDVMRFSKTDRIPVYSSDDKRIKVETTPERIFATKEEYERSKLWREVLQLEEMSKLAKDKGEISKSTKLMSSRHPILQRISVLDVLIPKKLEKLAIQREKRNKEKLEKWAIKREDRKKAKIVKKQ